MDINKYSFVANHDDVTQDFWKWFLEITSYSLTQIKKSFPRRDDCLSIREETKYSEKKWDQIII